MPMENQLAHAITQTEYDSSYDKAAKKLLANKQILAQIMKNCVNEYSACSVDEIAEKYIEGTPEVGTVGVHVDDTNRPKRTSDVIAGSNNEDSTLTEGTINYDVRFDAIAPASEGSAEQKDVIRLIINVEAQTAFNPGYPLTKRAIYYCSRMISAQHGPIFTNSEYLSWQPVSVAVLEQELSSWSRWMLLIISSWITRSMTQLRQASIM